MEFEKKKQGLTNKIIAFHGAFKHQFVPFACEDAAANAEMAVKASVADERSS